MTTEKKPRKPGSGRPAFAPTPEQRQIVTVLCGVGNSHATIATVIGIDEKTLRLHFAEELTIGADRANAQVGANIFKQATKDDFKAVPAAMFWMKTRAGWSEHGALPPSMKAQEQKTERVEKMGKKEMQDILAQNPDESTPMGSLMAQRRQTIQ